jgi:hypothetical protein
MAKTEARSGALLVVLFNGRVEGKDFLAAVGSPDGFRFW